MKTVAFRPAEAADVPRLAALMPDLYSYDGHAPDAAPWAAAVAELIGTPGLGSVWLIETGGELAGYAVLTYGYTLEYFGRYAFLDELYLVPTARGQGIGSQTIDFLVAHARAQGLRSLHLEVDEANRDGQHFYAARGFHYRGHMHLMSRPLP
ncbi:MAG: GNAT family N-acetyltransferase [Anaerolineae bacterium]